MTRCSDRNELSESAQDLLKKCALQGKDGKLKLLSANAGDARVILARGNNALQLSVDHVPDSCASQHLCPSLCHHFQLA